MGTGCISTYLIMKNSLPNFGNDIKIKSSKQFVLPVKFNKINDFKYKFFNSLPIFQLNLIKNKDYSLYSQIYNLNPNIINYFFPKVVNYKSYFFLLNLLKNYGFSYFNLGSEYSDSFIFDKNLNLKIYEKKYKVSNILNLETGIFKKSFLNNQFFHINIPIKMKSLSGNHFGSCFPMDKYRKNIYSSDLYGRIGQFKKISITDSSVFPELSARPPTLTILANSLRIVTEVSKLNFFNT